MIYTHSASSGARREHARQGTVRGTLLAHPLYHLNYEVTSRPTILRAALASRSLSVRKGLSSPAASRAARDTTAQPQSRTARASPPSMGSLALGATFCSQIRGRHLPVSRAGPPLPRNAPRACPSHGSPVAAVSLRWLRRRPPAAGKHASSTARPPVSGRRRYAIRLHRRHPAPTAAPRRTPRRLGQAPAQQAAAKTPDFPAGRPKGAPHAAADPLPPLQRRGDAAGCQSALERVL